MKKARQKLVKQIAVQLAMEFMTMQRAPRRARAKRVAKKVAQAAASGLDIKAAVAAPAAPKPLKITPHHVSLSRQKVSRFPQVNPFELPQFPVQLTDHVPADRRLAMDDAISGTVAWAGGALAAMGGNIAFEGVAFLGYPYLSELAQRPEYRVIVETIATEMTRKWIRLEAKGDEDKTEKIAELTEELERLKVREAFCKCAEVDGYFGRAHLYLDTGQTDIPAELKIPIGNGENGVSERKFKKGSFKRLTVVEPVWTYPSNYNSNNPLKPDWYNPQMWFVMQNEIHVSRCLRFVGREVPDMLKPSYSFGGLSLTQMAKPYVENWLNTRQSVSDIIRAFSVMVLGTNLGESLTPGGEELFARADLFNNTRDNRGLMMIDAETEEFHNVAAPLGSLDALQAQAQEHMCVQAGTLVATDRGQIPIEELTTSDCVLTRFGFEPIRWVGITGHTDTLVEIESGGSILRTTAEHPIWSNSTNEFVSARNVSHSHNLLVLRSPANTDSQSLGVADGGGRQKRATSAIRKRADSFIEGFGKLIAARSQKVATSTIGILMARTIGSKISNRLRAMTTWLLTGDFIPSLNASIHVSASVVAANSMPLIPAQYFVPERARLNPTSSRMGGRHSAPTPSNASAAGANSRRNVSASPGFAPGHACSAPVQRVVGIKVHRQPVYNLEVDGHPEFFANGILVHNCSVARIPIVKLLGISPHGLNATAEPELRAFYDTIKAQQEKFFSPNLRKVIAFAQMNIWGKVDPDISFQYENLWSLDEKGEAEVRKIDADTAAVLVDHGIIDPEEDRARVANDPSTRYPGLVIEDVPDLREEEEEGLEPKGSAERLAAGETDEDEPSADTRDAA